MTMTTTTKSKINVQSQQAADQAMIDGFTKHQSTIPSSLLIAGAPVPTTSVISTLQSRIAARTAVLQAEAAYHAAVQASEQELQKTQPLVSGARQAVGLMFAGQITALADFDMKPRKAPAPRTPEQKAASVAKAKATRAARHTMGAVQKAAITGANPQGTTAPAPAPSPEAAPVAAPAPAAAPPAAPVAGATRS
jgi:hypothetical protein